MSLGRRKLWPPQKKRREGRLHRLLWWFATVAALAFVVGLIARVI
jgi:hypothetical protein